MKEVLLNPGPVNLSTRVRESLLNPDLCHREIEFSQLQSDIRKKLLNIYALDNSDWASVLLTGSGTSAMEAMITSMVPDDGKVLIIENGVYGERLATICAIHDIKYESLKHEWGEEIDLARLQDELDNTYTYVAVVHHETTTGRLNDIKAVAEICKHHEVPVLLDGVSSFAAEEICFADWNLAACAGTANKCVHGIPGASFVICNRKMLDAAAKPTRTMYLDLSTYLSQQDNGATPFTQSVQSFYALNEALNEHAEDGGWRGRRKDYRSRMRRVIGGLHALGIESLLPDGDSSCVLHTFRLPKGISYNRLHSNLKQRGFIIYAGQGRFAESIFRISLMGDISGEDLERLLQAFNILLCK